MYSLVFFMLAEAAVCVAPPGNGSGSSASNRSESKVSVSMPPSPALPVLHRQDPLWAFFHTSFAQYIYICKYKWRSSYNCPKAPGSNTTLYVRRPFSTSSISVHTGQCLTRIVSRHRGLLLTDGDPSLSQPAPRWIAVGRADQLPLRHW